MLGCRYTPTDILHNKTLYPSCCLFLFSWEGRKELFYLTTLSTHFILRLCGVGHMVKDHSDSERGNPLPPHWLLFPISIKGYFICTIPQTGLHIPRPLLHKSLNTGWKEIYLLRYDNTIYTFSITYNFQV